MTIAEPSTQPRLSLPSREQMPEEIWGLWATEFQYWLTAGDDADPADGIRAFFSEQEAKGWMRTQGALWGDGELVPVLLWRKGAG